VVFIRIIIVCHNYNVNKSLMIQLQRSMISDRVSCLIFRLKDLDKIGGNQVYSNRMYTRSMFQSCKFRYLIDDL